MRSSSSKKLPEKTATGVKEKKPNAQERGGPKKNKSACGRVTNRRFFTRKPITTAVPETGARRGGGCKKTPYHVGGNRDTESNGGRKKVGLDLSQGGTPGHNPEAPVPKSGTVEYTVDEPQMRMGGHQKEWPKKKQTNSKRPTPKRDKRKSKKKKIITKKRKSHVGNSRGQASRHVWQRLQRVDKVANHKTAA